MALVKFRLSLQTPKDYLEMFVEVDSVLKQGSGLLWTTVDEILVQIHKVIDIITRFNKLDKDFIKLRYETSTGKEITESRLELIIETMREVISNGNKG